MISTGLEKLDEFLLGGIHEGIITDIYGANGTGKTQLLLQICINSIKNGGTVLFLDTTGGFRPERIIDMQSEQFSNLNYLEKITVLRITNTSEQIKSLETISSENSSLVVIDNISDLFSYEYPSEDLIFQKNTIFMKFLHDLSLISIEKKIPIVVSNMVRNVDGKEIENMKSAIDLFTHIKIKLSKNSTKFKGQINWLSNKNIFSYIITKSGLTSNTEDI
ncbi:recombinase RecA [Nitrosopumilus sp. K4]|uniref:ATPase domain-containing protein n=1 Tax=Nitrosopumilus sp. K4 TaxID=2795383 RepID=UPI001BA5CB85|nr:ATPase domain-containing protein [Nitrosopumilus sp. K4]QUC64485.1 recombinase RecA [Nitrosopumilus sp. K4]